MSSEENNRTTESSGRLMLEGLGIDGKYALIGFLSKGKGEHFVQIGRKHRAIGNIIVRGRGTARSEILDYLGLELDEKDIVISTVRAEHAQETLQALRDRLDMDRPGKGIAFLIPLLGSRGLKAVFRFAESMDHGHPEIAPSTDPALVSDDGIAFFGHDLVIAALHPDIVETAMDWARDAGATGGTILRGKTSGTGDFDGLPAVDQGKDLLLILVQRDDMRDIVMALRERLGEQGCGKAVISVLPVSAAVGLASQRLVIGDDGSVSE